MGAGLASTLGVGALEGAAFCRGAGGLPPVSSAKADERSAIIAKATAKTMISLSCLDFRADMICVLSRKTGFISVGRLYQGPPFYM